VKGALVFAGKLHDDINRHPLTTLMSD